MLLRSIVSITLCLLLVSMAGGPLRLSLHPLTKNAVVYISYHEFQGQPFPSNGLALITPKEIVLLDSPWTEEQTGELVEKLEKKYARKVTHCISTHYHADRTAGIDVLKQHKVKTWSSAQTKEWCILKGEKQPEFTFKKDTVFRFEGLTLETYYPGKGHSADNIVVWIPEKKILYGGCFVKSVEASDLGNLGDADTTEWKTSVKKVMKKFPDPAYIIPGHFGWKSKNALKHTLKLLEQE